MTSINDLEPSPRECDPLLSQPNIESNFSTPRTSIDPGESLHLSDLSLKKPFGGGRSHFFHLLMLCAGFFFVFSPYNTIQNLLSSIIPGRLGYISLSVVYGSFCFGALFISPISVKFLSPRIAMTLGSLSYTLFLASNLKMTYWSMIPAAALLGIGASILWAGQGTYLTIVASNYGGSAPDSVMGLFNGIFFAIFMSTQVFGNIGGSIILHQVSQDTDLIYTLIIISLIAIVIFFLLPREDFLNEEKRNEILKRDLEISTFTKITAAFRLWKDPKMQLLILPIFYSGLELGWISGTFTAAIIKPNLGSSSIGYIMGVLGLTDTIFSFVWGLCSDFKSGKKALAIFGTTIHLIFYVFFLIWERALHIDNIPTWVLFVSAAFYGIGDAVWQTLTSIFVSLLFQKDLEAGFSNLKFWSSLGFASAFLLGSYVPFEIKIGCVLFVLVLSTISVFILEIYFSPKILVEEEEEDNNNENDNNI